MRTFLWFTVLVLAAASLPAYRLTAQPVNIRISDPSIRDPEEVSIALNPRNLNQLAAGANIKYLFTSSDAGQTWDMSQMSSQYGFWGDPCLMFDDSGTLYYEHLSGQNWQDPQFLWRIVVQRSLDAGLNFDNGEEIGLAPPTMQDKAWLGLNRSRTASNGTLYTSWTEFDKYGSTAPLDSSRMYFSMSTDRGLDWSNRLRIDDTAGDCLDGSGTDEGITSTASPDGAIDLVWTAREKIFFNRSTDGGKTFSRDQVIADQPGGWDFSVPGISRANGFATIASDVNPESPYYGRLYVIWSDQRRGVTDVYSIVSSDNGATWSSPLRVNTDSALNHHFFPSMALDPVTGHIVVIFYDRRNYTDNETDVYLARSTDGGATFSNQRISESAFHPLSNIFFGDYIHIATYNRHIYPIWMRLDDSLLSIWTAPIFDSTSSLLFTAADRLWIVGDAVRPSVAFTLSESKQLSLEVFDLLGRPVQTLLSGDYGAGEYRICIPASIASGAYIIRMTAISQTNAVDSGFSMLVAKVAVP